MKILYHHRIASKDGQYVHIEEIINALTELGHEIIVIAPESTDAKSFGESSSLVKRIRQLLPDSLHEVVEFLYCFWDFLKISIAVLKHRPDVIYERYNLFFPSGIWAKKLFNIPLLLEVNSPLLAERAEHGGLSLSRLAKWSETYCWNNADYLLPVTGVLGRIIESSGADASKIVVIPNGVNKKNFYEVEKNAETCRQLNLHGKLVLGFVGFVREWHGLERVVDVLKKHEDKPWVMLVVGDGPALKGVQHRAQALGIEDKLITTGVVDRANVSSYMSCFDIALQPDVVAYASPLKLFEYLALSKPVLAPDTENIREILDNEQNGLLFDPENNEDFSNKLEALCLSDELRNRLGAGAAVLVEDRQLYWRANADKIVELMLTTQAKESVCE
jgi:glycosyltransferase involved in cell wall biosynthesis